MNFNNTLLIVALSITTLCLCYGGGSDVGNPDISGRVCDVKGEPVLNCEIVRGPLGGDPGRIDTIKVDGSVEIYVRSLPFDTVRSGPDGEFTFSEVPPGEYSILAAKDNLLGICRVDHKLYKSYAGIEINYPAKLVFDNYSRSMDTTAKAFKAARVSGTTITNDVKITDKISFSAVPAGYIDIILYRNNKKTHYLSDLKLAPLESLFIAVDPDRGEDYWTFKRGENIFRDPKCRPYVLSCTPVNGSFGQNAMINAGKRYDIEIQFSHTMNSKRTNNAISAISSDSNVIIDSLWWQAGDVLYIDLWNNKNSGTGVDSLYTKAGVKYSIIIDTTALSIHGVNFPWPDTISFVPVP